MIRPLSLLLLLGASAIVLGQPLYKWVEPDGSITFSVKPPPNGITFEQVDANESQAPSAATPGSEPRTNTISTPNPPVGGALPETVKNEVPAQRVAPQVNGGSQAQRGIFRPTNNTTGATALPDANAQRGVVGAVANNTASPSQNTPGRTAALKAIDRKQRQCEDLQKRVVSLERRLRSRLTPDDMDNTVVHMARYQRSYDQHCVQ